MIRSRFGVLALAILCTGAQVAGAQNARQAPDNAPSRVSIAEQAEPGVRMTVSGRVVGANGGALAGASLYVYQTDASGEYVRGMSGGGSDRPRLFAYLRSDAQGRYSFSTVKPGSYPGTRNPGHIHYEVIAAGHETRVYEIVFENDPFLSDAFRAQARDPFGGVAIVETKPAGRSAFDVQHDVRVKPR